MQIASTPTVTTVAKHPDFRGINVGVVDRPGFNWTVATGTGKNTVLGTATGYASFEDALVAARTLTAGARPAAAIFSAVDRFFLKEVFTDRGGSTAWTPYDGFGANRERTITFSRPDVRALVDGDVIARAGSVGTPTKIETAS